MCYVDNMPNGEQRKIFHAMYYYALKDVYVLPTKYT